MRILKEIYLFFKRYILEEIRQPVWVVAGLMTPLLYIALFSPLLKNIGGIPQTTAQVLNTFVPGILTLLAFNSGMGSGWTIVRELETGIIERFRVTPASRFSMLMGGVLSNMIAFLVPAILVIIISSFFGFSVHMGGLIILLILLCLLTIMVSAWSTSLGLILKQVSSMAAVITSSQLPLTLLSGVLLPISMGPVWLQILAHINPMYYTVEASRKLTTGAIISSEVGIAFAVVVVLDIITLIWATNVYKKAVA